MTVLTSDGKLFGNPKLFGTWDDLADFTSIKANSFYNLQISSFANIADSTYCVLATDSTVHCTGYNYYNALGINSKEIYFNNFVATNLSRLQQQQEEDNERVTSVCTGYLFGALLTSSGNGM